MFKRPMTHRFSATHHEFHASPEIKPETAGLLLACAAALNLPSTLAHPVGAFDRAEYQRRKA
jgi:hypothetical protein